MESSPRKRQPWMLVDGAGCDGDGAVPLSGFGIADAEEDAESDGGGHGNLAAATALGIESDAGGGQDHDEH